MPCFFTMLILTTVKLCNLKTSYFPVPLKLASSWSLRPGQRTDDGSTLLVVGSGVKEDCPYVCQLWLRSDQLKLIMKPKVFCFLHVRTRMKVF